MTDNIVSSLQLLSAIKGLEIVMRAVIGSTKWGLKTFIDHFERQGERHELVRQLFLNRGDFLFHPGTDWRPAAGQPQAPYVGRGYPHELHAIRAFVPFVPEKAAYQETLFFPSNLTVSRRLICTGSPKTNGFARTYLPSVSLSNDEARQQYRTFLRPDAVKYIFGEDLVAPKVKVVSMMEAGRLAEKTRKLIWTWKGSSDLRPWRPKGYLDGEKLRSDFLLLSRLPRTAAGGDILIFAGAHGAGTEAVSLLLNQLHIKQLRELVDILQGAPYFQFIVEITQVKHLSTGTIPKQIRLCEDLPPVRLDISAADLRQKATLDRKVFR